jgi:hypothetical protein
MYRSLKFLKPGSTNIAAHARGAPTARIVETDWRGYHKRLVQTHDRSLAAAALLHAAENLSRDGQIRAVIGSISLLLRGCPSKSTGLSVCGRLYTPVERCPKRDRAERVANLAPHCPALTLDRR